MNKFIRIVIMVLVSLVPVEIYALEKACLEVLSDHPELQIDQSVEKLMASHNMSREDFFSILKVVARYETNGCWSGAAGNFDGQLLSVGVMQWNFGQGSLQPLLKKFSEKFTSKSHFEKVRDELMPKYGKDFFDVSCRKIPVGMPCSSFLKGLRSGKHEKLDIEFKQEVDALFNSQTMQQIQLDYFARDMTSVLGDLGRVFNSLQPKSWQVAWAMDIKTQQGNKFPTNKNIMKIKDQTLSSSSNDRLRYLRGIIKWYEGLCDSGTSDGIRLDCSYNVNTWNGLADKLIEEKEKEETIHFTHLVSRTAKTQDGAYQANAFQRRATIVFGQGSVNGRKINFTD